MHARPAVAAPECDVADFATSGGTTGATSSFSCFGQAISYTWGSAGQVFVVDPITGFQQTAFARSLTGQSTGPGGKGSFALSVAQILSPIPGNPNSFSVTYRYAGTVFGQNVDCYVRGNTAIGTCDALSKIFGPGPSAVPAVSKMQAAGRQQRIVTNDILGAPLQTTNEIADQKQQTSAGNAPRVRLFLADAAVEMDSLAGAKTTAGGVTIGSTVEFENSFTVGAMIPLDYISFPGTSAERLGVVGFGQYNWHPAGDDAWNVKPTVLASYIYTAGNSAASFGTYGVGTGLSATYDTGGSFIPAIETFVSYNKDTVTGGTYQTLFAAGPRLGFRPSDNWVLEAGFLWNKDLSAYIPSGTKTDYFDLNADAAYRISGAFSLNVGYRKTLGISQFQSDEIDIGARFRF